jgi:ATP phosphoribosyltransferase
MRLGVACEGTGPAHGVLALLRAAGLCGELADVRPPALVPESASCGNSWLLASPADVLTACACSALDAAVAGKDHLLELEPGVHELLDLRVDADALVYACRELPGSRRSARPRVATRYVRVARRFFAEDGGQARVLEFHTPALAVRLGLADGVVELRGRLQGGAGGDLVERAEVARCSARLVCGRAAHTLVAAGLEDLVERLRAELEEL